MTNELMMYVAVIVAANVAIAWYWFKLYQRHQNEGEMEAPHDVWTPPQVEGMSEKDYERHDRQTNVMNMLIVALLLAVMWMVASCTTTKYVTVEKAKTDTTYITKEKRDSIWLHDSTFVEKKGDTVLIERWHTKYRDVYQLDTIYRATHDTIPQPYPVIQTVEKRLSWWQRTQIYIGDLTLVLAILGVAIWFIRKRLPL